MAGSLFQPAPDNRYGREDHGSAPEHNALSSFPISAFNPTYPQPMITPVSASAYAGIADTQPFISYRCSPKAFTSDHSISEADAGDDFVLRNARGRLIYTHRALLVLEDKWGPVDRWAANFGCDWSSVRATSATQIRSWLDSMREMGKMGRRLIGYFARVMDGEMPPVDEWRCLWLESYQLLGMLYTGVLGLEQRLDLVEQWYSASYLDNAMIVN
jgi:hypothetical protein